MTMYCSTFRLSLTLLSFLATQLLLPHNQSVAVQTRQSYFYQVIVSGLEQGIATFTPVTSLTGCTSLCLGFKVTDQVSQCNGFQLNSSDLTCRLLSNVSQVASDTLSEPLVFRKGQACLESLGFHRRHINDTEFCLGVFFDPVTYMDARNRCVALTSRLAHMDTKAKFKAVQDSLEALNSTETQKYWVGANDLENEGHWVYDANGQPLTSDVVWKDREPNNAGNGEHCGCLLKYPDSNDVTMNDSRCGSKRKFICEM